MSERLYAFGEHCTWHGYLKGDEPVCPECGQAATATSRESFYAQFHGRTVLDVVRWSEGKCFPDYDTLQNAHRQAMAGTE